MRVTRKTKQVIVIRRDLKMRRGKEIAQGSHASMAFLTRPMQQGHPGSISLGDILRTVANHFDIMTVELCSDSRHPDFLVPRQVAMYLGRELTDSSHKGIGKFFGNRDHATSVHAQKKVVKRMQGNPQLSEAIRIIREKLTAPRGTPPLSDAQHQWIKSGFTKVCVRAESEEELLAIKEKADGLGIVCHLVTDAGKTEFDGVPTNTCLAVGPDWSDVVDEVTGTLRLY
jgi:peptidyl-tRNA hydrolase